MDDIAHEIVLHYLRSTERVIQVVSEEADDIIDLNKEGGRYFLYFDPLDGSSNVAHGLPVGFHVRHRQEETWTPKHTGPGGLPSALRCRIHRSRHVRHPDRHVHPGPARCRLLAIPHGRDQQLRETGQDGAAGRGEKMGAFL